MFKRFFGFFLIITMAGGVALINTYYIPTLSYETVQRPDSTESILVETKEPKVVYGMIVNDDNLVVEDKIKRNERLGDILQQYNVPARLINEISNLSRKIFDPRKIAADKKYTLI